MRQTRGEASARAAFGCRGCTTIAHSYLHMVPMSTHRAKRRTVAVKVNLCIGRGSILCAARKRPANNYPRARAISEFRRIDDSRCRCKGAYALVSGRRFAACEMRAIKPQEGSEYSRPPTHTPRPCEIDFTFKRSALINQNLSSFTLRRSPKTLLV